MKKVLVTAIALFALCSIGYADMIIDLEIGTTNSTSTQPNIGGTGNQTANEPAGFTGPLYIWVYAKVTNGPVTPMAGYDGSLITSAQGLITENASGGVKGDMTWGTTKSTNGTKQTYLYSAGYPTGYPDFSTGSLAIGSANAYGDIDINDHNKEFGPANGVGGVEVDDYISWVPIGHLTYTVKAGSAGSSTITFTPDTLVTGAQYQYLNSGTGAQTTALGGTTGYTSTGSVLIKVVPEPSTLIMLGMACLALLAIKRRR